MDDGTRLSWIIVILLLLVSAYFAVAETAFAAASRVKIKTAAGRGESRAERALYVLDDFDRAISTILIGTNICHLSIASLVTMIVTRTWGLSAVTVSTIVTTLVVFFVAEMAPKYVAKKYPERLAKLCAPVLVFFMKLFKPLSILLTKIGQAAAKLTKGDPDVSVTEDELYDLIDDMTEDGTLDEEQGDLISSALSFGDVTVESILTPRVDMIAIDIETPVEEILETVREQNHSRIPVYEDSPDKIIGILPIRRFLKSTIRNGAPTEIRSLLEEPFYVHSNVQIDQLLELLSHNHQNLAIVTDEYGGVAGLVTVEDILEELVGDIWDEDDVVEEPILQITKNLYIVDADETVGDLFEFLDFEDPEDDKELENTRMGKWAFQQSMELPKPGDRFDYHGLRITVLTVIHNRIVKLKVETLSDPEEGGQA